MDPRRQRPPHRYKDSFTLRTYRNKAQMLRYNFHPNGLCVVTFAPDHPLQDLVSTGALDGGDLVFSFPFLAEGVAKLPAMGKKKKNAVRLKAADGVFRLDYGSSPDADELRRRFRGFFYARKSEGEAPTNVSARAALGGKVLELNELLLRDPKAALAGGVSNCYIVILQPSPQQLRQFLEGKEAAEGARGTARTRPAADADADAPQQPAKRRRGEGGEGSAPG